MDDLARALLAWYDRHGRHDLPWKAAPTPYRVWVSEIMLQQTQVKTVVPYYERFIARFPDVAALADAELDEVLHHWTGLGYYARGRNLHRAARIVRDDLGGVFPSELEALMALPGIGRSTAGAILALACGQRHPILDGNVKRVLARYHAIEGWPGTAKVAQALWAAADAHAPCTRLADYTQAMMDLGATVCTRTRPACLLCPLAPGCRAGTDGRPVDFPAPRPRRALPTRSTVFVIARDGAGRVLLEQRPPTGIWGGLWGFPEIPDDAALPEWSDRVLGLAAPRTQMLPPIHHGFTHYRLDIHPRLIEIPEPPSRVMEGPRRLWYKREDAPALGLAAPVVELLKQLAHEEDP